MTNARDVLEKSEERDQLDSYFECITACSWIGGEDVECTTACIAPYLEKDHE